MSKISTDKDIINSNMMKIKEYKNEIKDIINENNEYQQVYI